MRPQVKTLRSTVEENRVNGLQVLSPLRTHRPKLCGSALCGKKSPADKPFAPRSGIGQNVRGRVTNLYRPIRASSPSFRAARPPSPPPTPRCAQGGSGEMRAASGGGGGSADSSERGFAGFTRIKSEDFKIVGRSVLSLLSDPLPYWRLAPVPRSRSCASSPRTLKSSAGPATP
jgi:hypothetical protein